MPLLYLAALCALVALTSAAFVLLHAFRRSVGTGVMVLLIPCYVLLYAFSQFEHPRKGLVLAGFFGGSLLAAVFLAVGAHALAELLASPMPPPSF